MYSGGFMRSKTALLVGLSIVLLFFSTYSIAIVNGQSSNPNNNTGDQNSALQTENLDPFKQKGSDNTVNTGSTDNPSQTDDGSTNTNDAAPTNDGSTDNNNDKSNDASTNNNDKSNDASTNNNHDNNKKDSDNSKSSEDQKDSKSKDKGKHFELPFP